MVPGDGVRGPFFLHDFGSVVEQAKVKCLLLLNEVKIEKPVIFGPLTPSPGTISKGVIIRLFVQFLIFNRIFIVFSCIFQKLGLT